MMTLTKNTLTVGSIFVMIVFFCQHINAEDKGIISGELKKWHNVTITFEGPAAEENGNPNPFLDFRLNVIFSNGEKTYTVPGYFAADGNAANTSASKGNKWRVHFAPDGTGTWYYIVSFRKGPRIAGSDASGAGESAGFMDGNYGTILINPTDKTGRDFRGKGRLNYVGGHYLQFAETGEYFLKCGADAPENFLAYEDFDGNFKQDGYNDELVKDWAPHLNDWNQGDPTWQDSKGKGIIGAINYLASKGMNVFSFLTLNILGDDRNVFPYTTYDERYRFDVSKLDQWEVVFDHADKLGLYLHFKTQEEENQMMLDGGYTGLQRKLYYRELIARFGHHLALNWNLGEENGSWSGVVGQSIEQRRAMAQYLHDHDPYKHHIVVHNGQSFHDLLGNLSRLTGLSIQTNETDFSRVHGEVLYWLKKAEESGKPWVVAVDEPGDPNHALLPDDENPEHNNARKNALWGTLLAGGAGIEWYFGYEHSHSDLNCQDWRSRDKMWDFCKIALDFFEDNSIPFWEMRNADDLCSGNDAYVFYKKGDTYIVYLKQGQECVLDLTYDRVSYQMQWFNPRSGKFVGNKKNIIGGKKVNLPSPPANDKNDWIIFLQHGLRI
jgi:hypothetical protein